MTTIVFRNVAGKVDVAINGKTKQNVAITALPVDNDIQDAVSAAIAQPGFVATVRNVERSRRPRYAQVYGVAQ